MNERLKNLRLIPEVNFRRAGGTRGASGDRGAMGGKGARAQGGKILGLIEEKIYL